MGLRELTSAASLILLQAAFISWIMLGPFAWILRDGLGPDSVETHGSEAVVRALRTFYWGPILLALGAACWLCKKRAPLPEDGWQKRWVLIASLWVTTIAVSFFLMSETM